MCCKESGKKGLTLIEVLVASAIFSFVLLGAVSAVLSVASVNQQIQVTSTTIDNLSFALESMAREIRVGRNYYCDTSASIPALIFPPPGEPTQDCPDGGTFLMFEGQFGKSGDSTDQIIYRLNEDAGGMRYVERSLSEIAGSRKDTWVRLTAPDIEIDDLRFFVSGTDVLIYSIIPEYKGGSATTGSDGATRVAVGSAGVAYVLDVDEIVSFDVLAGDDPEVLDSEAIDGGLGGAIALRRNRAYVVSRSADTIQSINIGDPRDLRALGTPLSVNANPSAIALKGDRAYITNLTADTVQSIDISTPVSLSIVDTLTTADLIGDGPTDIAISGNYAFIVNRDSNTIQSIDISDPNSMTLEDTEPVDATPISIAISGDYAYIVNKSDTLQSVDISNPTIGNITVADTINRSAFSVNYTDISVTDSFAYVTDTGNDTVEVFDISDPYDIKFVSEGGVGGFDPRSIDVFGTTALVANLTGSRLEKFDISLKTDSVEKLSTQQPFVTIVLSGTGSDSGAEQQSVLQTTVSQRVLDI